MLVHICCSVDSHYFLQRLKKEYPNERLIGYFYDPNIHPYSEFLLRYEDVKASCEFLGIELYCGEYDFASWFEAVKGYEDEPEKGKRCQICFDFRMGSSAKLAKELGEEVITTTLLMSPKKSHLQLENSLKNIASSYGIKYYAPDYRKNGGSTQQFDLARKDMLYHQNYCGCVYALKKQKEHTFELMSPLNRQVLPSSIEEKIEFYKNVHKLKKNNEKFQIIREKFLNYRLLRCVVKFDGIAIKSHILYNSHFKRKINKFDIDKKCDDFYTQKDEIRLISIDKFCKIAGLKISLDELFNGALSIEKELEIRFKISKFLSLSPIIIVQNLPICKVVIEANSEIFIDTKEIIVK